MKVTPLMMTVSALLYTLASGSILSPPEDLNLTQVRIGHTLNEGEKQHVTRRRLTVQQCLKKLHIPSTVNKVPNIALIGSGGGQRAMVGLLASVLELKKQGLLDCMMYLSGVSGSTWGMASLYKHANWSSNLKPVTMEIVQRLDGLGVLLRYPEKWDQYDNFNQAHGWSAHVVTTFVKEIDEHVLSEQRGKHDMDPYPIYTVIDKEIRDRQQTKSLKGPGLTDLFEADAMTTSDDTLWSDNAPYVGVAVLGTLILGLYDVWVEMTPHEAGYSLTGAFVDQRYFGSNFDNGKLIKKQPEMDMLYVQGDLFAGLIKPTFSWGTTYNFLHNMRAEEVREVDSHILKSGTRDYIDAGLLLNAPYFSVLRPERKVDLIISLDYSEGDPMKTILDAYKMSMEMGIAFPRVEFPEMDREKPKDIYVFSGDDNTPTVIHMPLFNRGNCNVSDDCELENIRERYRTLQAPLDPAKIKELMKRACANVINTKSTLLEEIRKAVSKMNHTRVK